MTSTTLTEFLENTGAQLRFYDLGRRVSAIARDDFLAFERTEQPYPYPMQQKAWFALVQTRALEMSEPIIWFLRFELDEQGKLVQATRDYFIHRFIELATEGGETPDLGKALEDNPNTFKPRDDKMANFHATLSCDLGLPASQFFTHARSYFDGELGWDQWNFLAYQGIADIAARQNQDGNDKSLSNAIAQLPDEPLVALSQCLENHTPSSVLADTLAKNLKQRLQNPQTSAAILAALLRAISQYENPVTKSLLIETLQHPNATDPEVLAAVGGRLWQHLDSAETLVPYLDLLASEAVGQDIFNHCVTDLLRQPELQQKVLDVIRSPSRSDQLASAFQHLLGQ